MTIDLKNTPKRFTNFLLTILGSAIAGFAVSCFLSPNRIVSGGITGISIVVSAIFPIPVAFVTVLLNIPIFAAGIYKFGRKLGWYTVLGTLALSLFISVFEAVGSLTDDIFLASVFGGALSGCGFGIVFYAGATTGGIDIVAKLIKVKQSHLSLGKIILFADVFIIGFAVCVFKNVNTALYSVISFFICSFVTDFILEGFNFAKLAFVVSDNSCEIADKIGSVLNRGVTFLYGSGAYSGKFKKILMCTIKNKEIPIFKDIIKTSDQTAFVFITDAREVLGKGFSQIKFGG